MIYVLLQKERDSREKNKIFSTKPCMGFGKEPSVCLCERGLEIRKNLG